MTPRNTTPEGFRTAAYLATKARLDATARSRTGKTARGVDCNPPNVKCGGRCIPPNWDCRLEGKGPDPHLRAVRTDPVSGLANIERGVKRLGKGVRKGSFSEIEGGKRAIVRGIVKATPGDLQRKKALQAQLERRAGGIAAALAVVGFGLFTHSQLKKAPFYRDGVGRQIDDAVAAGINRILDATPGIRGARAERRAAGAATAGAAAARAAGEAATGPEALSAALLRTPTELERRATDYGNARVLLNRVGAVDVDAAGRGANAETWRQQSLEAFWSTKRTNAAGAGDGSTFSEPATHEYLSRQFGFRLGASASDTDVRRQLTSALNREAASLQALARQQGVNINDATQRSRFLNRLVGPSTANFPENVRERAVGNLNQILGAAPRTREAAVSRTELANRIYRETRDGFDQYFGRIADEVRQTPGVAMPTEQRRAGYSDLLNSARIGHSRYLAQRLAKPDNVTSRIGQGLSDAISKEYFARQVNGSSTFSLSDRETRTAASELAGRDITGLADATRYLQQNGFERLVPVRAAAQPATGIRAAASATPPRVRRSSQAQITDLARSLREAAQRRGETMSLEASYRAARSEITRRQRGDARIDAEGKPCGASHIPKAHECRKSGGAAAAAQPTESGKPSARTGAALAAAAAGAALTVGGLLAYKQRQTLVPSLSQKAIRGLSAPQVKEGLDKLPEKFRDPARQLVGDAKLAAAHMALRAQGSQIRAVDIKNNFSTWVTPNGTHLSVGSIGDSLLTFGAERKGNVSKFPQYGLGFTIDSKYDAAGGMPSAQAKQLIRTTKAMYQSQLEMLPENAVLFAVPHKDDGKGAKRKSIYEGMGFQAITGLKTDRLWALKNQGKFTKIPEEQMGYMAGLIRGDRADAATGKPCGASHIPKAHNCSKTAGGIATAKKPKEGSSNKRLALAAAAAGAAALAITAPAWTPAAQRILNNAKPFDKNNPPQGAKYLTEGVSGRTWISQDDKYVIKTPKGKVDKAAFANEVNTQNALYAAGISVPKIHNADPTKGVVMMDYLKGYDTVKSLTSEQRGKAVQGALREVEKMHRLGYSHGDLHMGNVLTKGNDVKLIDFGNAGATAKNGLSDINSLLSAAKDTNTPLYTAMVNRKKALQTKISKGEALTQKDLLAFHEAVRQDLRRST